MVLTKRPRGASICGSISSRRNSPRESECSLLVEADEPAIAGNISGEDRDEATGRGHSVSPAARRRPER